MQKVLDAPLIVSLMGLGALAMLVPALHALLIDDHATSRAFLYSAILTGILFLTGSVNWIGQLLLETFPGLGTVEELLVPDDLQMEIMRKSLEGSE